MLIPPFLQKGSTIGIAATARKVSLGEIQPAIDLFNNWGLKVELASNLFLEHHQFAGTDKQRAQGLQELLDHPNVNAIIIARGGYGNVRMVDQLDFTQFQKYPKWLIGFSDITVLQSEFLSRLNAATLHAPMAFNFQAERWNAESVESLRKVLFGEGISIQVPAHEFNTYTGELIKAELFGGNLSVLYSLLGSSCLPEAKGRMLFLEDLDEYVYHIDRMMMGLKRAGFFNGLKAVLVGDMSDMKDNLIPFGKNAYQIIHEHISELGIPLVFGLPCGHEKLNLSLAFGVEAELSSSNGNILISQF